MFLNEMFSSLLRTVGNGQPVFCFVDFLFCLFVCVCVGVGVCMCVCVCVFHHKDVLAEY